MAMLNHIEYYHVWPLWGLRGRCFAVTPFFPLQVQASAHRVEGSYAYHYTTNAHNSLQYRTAFRAKVHLYTPPTDVQLVRDCPKPGIHFCEFGTLGLILMFSTAGRDKISLHGLYLPVIEPCQIYGLVSATLGATIPTMPQRS